MQYKQTRNSKEFEFSNGWIAELDDEDITIFEERAGGIVLTEPLDRAKQIYEVLGELLKEK